MDQLISVDQFSWKTVAVENMLDIAFLTVSDVFLILSRRSLRPTSISFNTTMTSALRGQQWPMVLELMKEMRRRKLRFSDSSFNVLASVYEQNSAWKDALQCLAVAEQEGGRVRVMVIGFSKRRQPNHKFHNLRDFGGPIFGDPRDSTCTPQKNSEIKPRSKWGMSSTVEAFQDFSSVRVQLRELRNWQTLARFEVRWLVFLCVLFFFLYLVTSLLGTGLRWRWWSRLVARGPHGSKCWR